MLVLVVVAVIIVAALAGVAYYLATTGQPPPSGPTLASVVMTTTPGSTFNQTETVTVTAKALDTDGKDQTANVTWSWSASPSTSVNMTKLVDYRYQAKGLVDGTATVTAQATLSGTQKSGTVTLTIEPVRFVLVPLTAVAEIGAWTQISVNAVKPPSTPFRSYAGTINFTSTDPNAMLPKTNLTVSLTFSPSDQGSKSFPILYGTYGLLTVTANDTVAPTVKGSAQVTADHRPEAVFTNQSNPNDGRIVMFTSMSKDRDGDAITSLSWEFGDGATATTTTASISHTYTVTSPVSVSLTVTDAPGLLSAKNSTRYHPLAPPIGRFTVDRQRVEGAGVNVTVNATRSTDVDGGGIAIYNWTWDDLEFSEVANPIAYHVYGSAYVNKFVNVTLRVTDDDVTFYGAAVPHSNSTKFRFQVTALPQPPVASFTWTVDSLNLTVHVDSSATSDPNGDIAFLNWSWGDGMYTNVTYDPAVTKFSHQYTYERNFQINLTAIDKTTPVPFTDVHRETAPVFYPPVPPIARFTVVKSGLRVDVDASTSTDLNKDIVSYEWDFTSDVTVDATDVIANHTYPAAGTYKITLKVTDSQPKSSVATRKVSVYATTLDYYFWDFFNVPYQRYWDYRGNRYGDLPVGVDCFNASAVAEGFCAAEAGGHHASDFSSYTDPSPRPYRDIGPPYTNWYPAVGNIRPGAKGNNPFLYAPYRWSVSAFNIPNYGVWKPVFLPVFNYSALPNPDSYLSFDWDYRLQTLDDLNYFLATCGKAGSGFLDGFDEKNTLTMTMDFATSRRIFGVTATTPADAVAWWANNADSGPNACRTKSPIETKWGSWLLEMGGTSTAVGKYDVANGCEWYYIDVMSQINGTVDPTTGVTTVTWWSQSYTLGCLLARWFYWGNTSYATTAKHGLGNWYNSSKREGWWGMELAWFEDMLFGGRLGYSSMNFNLSTIMQYHFQQESLPGPDGQLNKVGDIPVWMWRPVLNDYLTNFNPSQHPVSELNRYPSPGADGIANTVDDAYMHSTPGATDLVYGRMRAYVLGDIVPIVWNLQPGEEWHFQFPRGNVIFYDPRTIYGADPTHPFTLDPTVNGYIRVMGPLDLNATRPASSTYWDLDKVNKTWDIYGPAAFGGTQTEGSPGPDGLVGTSDDRYALEGNPDAGARNVVPKISFRNTTSSRPTAIAERSTLASLSTAPSAASSSAALVAPKAGSEEFLVKELKATFPVVYFRRES